MHRKGNEFTLTPGVPDERSDRFDDIKLYLKSSCTKIIMHQAS